MGGVLAGVAAILTGWAALRRAKQEKDEECMQRLAQAREDADRYYGELRDERAER